MVAREAHCLHQVFLVVKLAGWAWKRTFVMRQCCFAAHDGPLRRSCGLLCMVWMLGIGGRHGELCSAAVSICLKKNMVRLLVLRLTMLDIDGPLFQLVRASILPVMYMHVYVMYASTGAT